MSAEGPPEDDENPAEPEGSASDWDTNNETESYAFGEGPDATPSGFRSVDLGVPVDDGSTGAFDAARTNQTQRYGAPARKAPQASGQIPRPRISALDDDPAAAPSVWDGPVNTTQQYAGPQMAPDGATTPADGGWGDATNKTQVYGSDRRRAEAARALQEDDADAPNADGWGGKANQTRRYAPSGSRTASTTSGGWDAVVNRTQRYVSPTPMLGAAQTTPSASSPEPPPDETIDYEHELQAAQAPDDDAPLDGQD